MNFKIKTKQRIAAIFFAFLIFFTPLLLQAMSFKYTPMEEIPGFGKPTTYEAYVLAIYKFGLWTVGISAVLMISIGAFMYITSAGNTSQSGKAKGIIVDAIIGVVLALLSYIALYTINPNLVRINPLPTSGAAGTPGAPNGPSGTTAGYKKACPDSNSTVPIDYSKATNDTDIKLSSACDQYKTLFDNNSSKVDPCLLRTMAQMESSCGSNKGPSPSGACGLMQLLPATASGLAGKTVSCTDLINSDELSIKLAAEYIKQKQAGSCAGAAKDKNSAIFAGYNSGYGCTGSACSPEKHALCPSGAVGSGGCGTGCLAFECCVDPGGLEESINYAWNGVGLYAKCGGK